MKYAKIMQQGTVSIHPKAMERSSFLSTLSPDAAAAPAMAQVFVWVVEAGIPRRVIRQRERALPISDATAEES